MKSRRKSVEMFVSSCCSDLIGSMNIEDAFDFGSPSFRLSNQLSFVFDGIDSTEILENIHHDDKHHQTRDRHNSNERERFRHKLKNDNSSCRHLTLIAKITSLKTFTQRRIQQRPTLTSVFTRSICTRIHFSFTQVSFAITRTRTSSLLS